MHKTAALLALVLVGNALCYGAEKERTAITVYNTDLALVKQTRTMTFQAGTNTVELGDVPSRIRPGSVRFGSLTKQDALRVVEQDYEYDLASTQKLLEKYLGQTIQVFAKGDKLHEGTLLSFSGEGLALQSKDETVVAIKSDVIENVAFPKLPEGLITHPTLMWQVQSDRAGKHDVEITYLTGGMNWEAEYTALLDDKREAMKLGAWVSIDNRCGATYKDAALKLVAGTLQRAEERAPYARMAKAATLGAEDAGFEEEALFEYHLYSLGRAVTLKDNRTKQISLFPATQVEVTQQYHYDGSRHGEKVRAKLEFVNSNDAGVGTALPGGKVRLYMKDKDGSLQLIGEDRIGHTPENKKVLLAAGDAFDVAGERKMTEHQRVTDRTSEEQIEIKLRNDKRQAVTVIVTEHLRGQWEIRQQSHDFVKKDAYTIEFSVPVPKSAEEIVRYRVRYTR